MQQTTLKLSGLRQQFVVVSQNFVGWLVMWALILLEMS